MRAREGTAWAVTRDEDMLSCSHGQGKRKELKVRRRREDKVGGGIDNGGSLGSDETRHLREMVGGHPTSLWTREHLIKLTRFGNNKKLDRLTTRRDTLHLPIKSLDSRHACIFFYLNLHFCFHF